MRKESLKTIKRMMAVFLTFVLTASLLTGCGSSSDSSETKKSIVIQCANTEGDLDPAGVALGMFMQYEAMCLEPLIRYDQSGELVYEAAESYTVSDDQLTWTFHLRKDDKWSDGSNVTAADFVNTVKRALDHSTSTSVYADMLSPIKGASEAYTGKGSVDDVGVYAKDDYTLVFELNEPCSYFLKLCSLQCVFPSKDGVATASNPSWYTDPSTSLGNGAFHLTEYVAGQYYVVEKNPNYYNASNVKLDKITVKVVDDATTAASAYKTGELDYATNLSSFVTTEYANKEDLKVTSNITTRFVLFNVTKAPFDNANVRKAISFALNRSEICKTIGDDYEGSYTYVAKYMKTNLGTGKNFSDETDPLIKENTATAKELLAQAGYPDGQGFPTITYNYPNNEQDKLIAQGIQAQLKANLNINVELNAMESQVCVSERKSGNFQMTRHNWTADYDDPMDYLLMWTTTAGTNDAKISNAEYDSLLAQAAVAKDETTRNTLMHQAEKILVEDEAYVAPISTQKTISLLNPKITGVTWNSAGQIDWRNADITK